MVTVGIGELSMRASELIRMVERGERVQITDRERPVAMLSPIAEDDLFERLVQEGRITRGMGSWADLPAPAEPAPGVELPGVILERMRRAPALAGLPSCG